MRVIKADRYKWESWSDVLKLKDFVVLDVETTGLDCKKERIIEIGMIKVSDGISQGEFHSLVNPEKPIPARITKLTGLSDEDVKDAPTFREIAAKIADFLGESVIMAHNAVFDTGFLANEFAGCDLSKKLVYFDTLALSRKAYPLLQSHKLEELISFLQIADTQTHRALDDARQTLQLYTAIYNHYNTPYALAVAACCSPMVDYQITDVDAKPLDGKHVVLMGDYTFSQTAAKKMIAVAGGVVDPHLTGETDYLLYGYFDRFRHPPEQEKMVDQAILAYQNGAHTQPINEVAFLKLCGVTFNVASD